MKYFSGRYLWAWVFILVLAPTTLFYLYAQQTAVQTGTESEEVPSIDELSSIDDDSKFDFVAPDEKIEPQKMKIALYIPFVPEKYALKAEATEKGEEGIFAIQFPTKAKKLNLGVITLETGEFLFKPEGTIGYEGKATILGKPAVVGIKSIELMTEDEYKDRKEALSAAKLLKYDLAVAPWKNYVFGEGPAESISSLKDKMSKFIREEDLIIPKLHTGEGEYDLRLVKSITFGVRVEGDGVLFNFIPGKTLRVRTCDLVLNLFDQSSLDFSVEIFGQKTKFSIILDLTAQDLSGKVEFEPRALKEVFPGLESTPFSNVFMSGFGTFSPLGGFSLAGLISDGKGKRVDLEILPGLKVALETVSASFGIGRAAKVKLSAAFQGKPVILEGSIGPNTKKLKQFGVEKAPKTIVSTSLEIKNMMLGDIIKELKDTFMDALIFEGKLLISNVDGIVLDGSVKSSDKEKGLFVAGIKFKESGKLRLDTGKKTGTIHGQVEALGLVLESNLSFDFGASPSARFMIGIGMGSPKWKPFDLLPKDVPGLSILKDVSIYDVGVGFEAGVFGTGSAQPTIPGKQGVALNGEAAEGTRKALAKDTVFAGAFYIRGKANIINTEAALTARAFLGSSGAGMTFIVELPKGWKLSQSFPELFVPKTVISEAVDLIKLDDARLQISTSADKLAGTDAGCTLSAGVSISGAAENLALKALDGIIKKTGNKGVGLRLIGNIDITNLKIMSLKMGLATGDFSIVIPPATFKAAALYLVVRGEPSLAFEGSFQFIPGPGQEPLLFAGELGLTAMGIGCDLSMKGIWKDPLNISKIGVTNIEFGNLGVKFYETYAAISAAIESAGASLLVPELFAMSGEGAIGKQKPLHAKLAFGVGVDLSSMFIDAKIENLSTLADLTMSLFEMINLQLPPDLFKVIPCYVDSASLKIVPIAMRIGNISFNAGVGGSVYVKVLGKTVGCALELSTNGLILRGSMDAIKIGDIEITNADDSGKGPLLDITIHLQQGFNLELDGRIKIGELINTKTKILASTKGLAFDTETTIGPKEAGILARIKAVDLSFKDTSKLAEQLKLDNLALTIEFTNTLTDALNKSINAEFNRIQGTLKQDIDNTLEQLKRRASMADIQAQEQRVKEAEGRRVLFFKDPALSVLRELDVQKEITTLNLLKLKKGLEETVVGQALFDMLNKLGVTKLAADTLKTLGTLGIGVIDQGKMVFNQIANMVIVRKVYWSGSVTDVTKGTLPSAKVDVTLLGTDITQDLGEFNIKDPVGSIQHIATALVDIAQKALFKNLSVPSAPFVSPLLARTDDIFEAIKKGDVASLDTILAANPAALGQHDEMGLSPVAYAYKSPAIVIKMWEKGVKLDGDNNLLMMKAAEMGEKNTIDVLLRAGIAIPQLAIDIARQNGKESLAGYLEQRRTIAQARLKELIAAIKAGSLSSVVNLLNTQHEIVEMRDESGMLPVFYAGLNKNIVEIFDKNGSDIGADDGVLYYFATGASSRPVIEYLINRGLPIPQSAIDLARENRNNELATYLESNRAAQAANAPDLMAAAVRAGDKVLVERLLKNYPAAKDQPAKDGMLPFYYAGNKLGIVELFNKYGANLRAGDGALLYYASGAGDSGVVNFLVNELKLPVSQRAIDIARTNGYPGLAAQLEKAMAAQQVKK
ncbi:MAG: hypothetical protein UV38_C0003G0196 [candidate division TM6 bacterium GW2011_GWE2_42_60]|nr:MAG: hypothetical protein UV38_C0003G0196 [candidate division TM6 bacterium GW2011_GWE2_42_60]HBY05815.1 hypothetical protein [Candidatus Dependentiae bacterium]